MNDRPVSRKTTSTAKGGLKWHYQIGEEQKGPVTVAQIEALVDAGVVTLETKVWRKGMDEWCALRNSDLADAKLFSDELLETPPPVITGSASAQTQQSAASKPVIASSAGALSTLDPAAIEVGHWSDNKILSQISGGLLWVLGVTNVLLIVNLIRSWAKGDRELETAMLLYVSDGFVMLSGFVSLAFAIIYCFWKYRAYANLYFLGTKGLDYTPGWAVGWYFIPILNIWKPYDVMSQLWRASFGSDDWKEHKHDDSINVWWWFLIGAIVISAFSAAIWENAQTVAAVKFSAVLDIASLAIEAISIVALSEIIKKVTNRQNTVRLEDRPATTAG